MSEVFEMPVQSMFHIASQGTILHGKITSGCISIGCRIVVKSPGQNVSAKVAAIEEFGTKNILSSARTGVEIAILVRNLNLNAINKGWKIGEKDMLAPVALKVCNDSRPWWQFWP